MKKKIIIIVLFLTIVLLNTYFILLNKKISGNEEENNKKITEKNNGVVKNTNEEVLKDVKVKDLDVTNISISYLKGTGSTYSAKIKNNTDNEINLESFDIVFYDKNDKEITTITVFVGGNFKPNQVNGVKSTVLEDLTKAIKLEYKTN